MKKLKIVAAIGIPLLIMVTTLIILFASHTICIHYWKKADCLYPRTCSKCSKTDGKPLGHDYSELTCTEDEVCLRCGQIGTKAKGHQCNSVKCDEDQICTVCNEVVKKASEHKWKDATCTDPQVCSVCGETGEKAKGHKWKDATCTEPKTCSVCKKTEGKKLGHDWAEATTAAPKTCKKCGKTEGEKLKSYDTYFSADDIVENAGVSLGGHVCVMQLDYVECSNGTASSETEDAFDGLFQRLNGISVTGAAEGAVTISGTVTTYGVERNYSIGDFEESWQNPITHADKTYEFNITKYVG